MEVTLAHSFADLSGLDIAASRGPHVLPSLPPGKASVPQLNSNIEDAIRPTDALKNIHQTPALEPQEPPMAFSSTSARNWTSQKFQSVQDVSALVMGGIFKEMKTLVNNASERFYPPLSAAGGAGAQMVKYVSQKKGEMAEWSSLAFDVIKNQLRRPVYDRSVEDIGESSFPRVREQVKTAHNLVSEKSNQPTSVEWDHGTQKAKHMAKTQGGVLEWTSLAFVSHWIRNRHPLAHDIGKLAIRQISRGAKKIITRGREPISVKGDDAAYIANYMAEHQAQIDNRLINQLYDSLSAENVEPAKVKYSIEVIEFIRAPAKGWDRSYLFEYFQRKLGLSEFVRRKNVLLLQAEEHALQEAWPKQAIEISRITGYDAETINKYAKVLGMGEYFPAFKNQPGMEKNIRRLAFLQQTLPQLHDAFKDALGDIAYHSRMCIMSVMDNLISPDIPEFLITEWQEQGFSVSRIVQIIDYTRYDTVEATIPWRGNPPEYNKVSKMIHSLNSNILEDKEITQFLVNNDGDLAKFEALEREIHMNPEMPMTPFHPSNSDTPFVKTQRKWWEKLLEFLKQFIPKRFQASHSQSVSPHVHSFD
ncbi:hypothetical protein PCASD_19953 [Puccinia coronata f. sp. avenae]|uniref:Uncharacterized protein n=1 Tax=Puccinia coronata f. sp. avenae TaxID=200324 RepID=A0A2N5SHZ0_9BASI|nr:hypothetical protein PCASD_19953 [Puccinia coronata f. sp. avenae]